MASVEVDIDFSDLIRRFERLLDERDSGEWETKDTLESEAPDRFYRPPDAPYWESFSTNAWEPFAVVKESEGVYRYFWKRRK